MEEYSGTIDELRQVIDELDKDLVSVIAERFQIVERLALLKKKEGAPIVQNDRWENIINECIAYGKEMSVDETFLRKILNDIHSESIRIQQIIFE